MKKQKSRNRRAPKFMPRYVVVRGEAKYFFSTQKEAKDYFVGMVDRKNLLFKLVYDFISEV